MTFANPSLAHPAVLELLACPACHAELRPEAGRIVCTRCARVYPILNGIPVLIADRTTPPPAT